MQPPRGEGVSLDAACRLGYSQNHLRVTRKRYPSRSAAHVSGASSRCRWASASGRWRHSPRTNCRRARSRGLAITASITGRESRAPCCLPTAASLPLQPSSELASNSPIRNARSAAESSVCGTRPRGSVSASCKAPLGPARCLTFYPDGTRLAATYWTAESKSGVVIFDVETGKNFRQLEDFLHSSNT